MTQEVTIVKNQVKIAFSGRIDVNDAAAILKNLIDMIENGHSSIFIDLSSVDYIACEGLGVLITIQKRARLHGGSVVINDLIGPVKRSVQAHSRGKKRSTEREIFCQ